MPVDPCCIPARPPEAGQVYRTLCRYLGERVAMDLEGDPDCGSRARWLLAWAHLLKPAGVDARGEE